MRHLFTCSVVSPFVLFAPLMPLMPLMLLMLLMLPGAASAQVYKCADASGTVTYSGTPCITSAKTQQLTKIDTSPSAPPAEAKNWDQENQDFAQRRRERNAKDAATQNRWAPGAAKAAASSQNKQANQGLISACEKNHGVRCSDPNVIAQMKKENTPVTKQEQQWAIGERRARERDEAFNRASGR
ncbi:DUF4124 domain-containing protein [Undibacterium sp.]|uniref:DUF4124 domain-containing protein n=1 Tax=Undibacterium sp. TaxID=1914977 RepID=UPI00374DC223